MYEFWNVHPQRHTGSAQAPKVMGTATDASDMCVNTEAILKHVQLLFIILSL